MFINPYLLSEPRLYEWLRNELPDLIVGKKSLDFSSIKKIAYTCWHNRNTQHADQLFHSHWEQLMKRSKDSKSLTRSLLGQVARFHFDSCNSRLSVRLEKFDQWQSWISNQSGLPVIAYQAEKLTDTYNATDNYMLMMSHLGYRSLLSPFHPVVEDYIEQNGLNDTHIHLNGTTSIEAMWDYALCNSNQVASDLEEEFHERPRVQLLYARNPCLDHPRKFEELLILARHLRQLLIAWGQAHALVDDYKANIVSLLKPSFLNLSKDKSGWSLERQYFDKSWSHLAESALHISVNKRLKEEPSEALDACYLLYILCMNCFQHLMVQRNDQFGFEQFQKFADDGIRDSFEKTYIPRFFQLHGPNINGRPDLLTIEGRFAPKKNIEKNEEIISNILRGFLAYTRGSTENSSRENRQDINQLADEVSKFRRPCLKLVSHFIKTPWDYQNESHFRELRERLIEQGNLLFTLLKKYPALKKVITGIDAAANELEAPPEVFGSLYRLCRKHGITQATYHVGEDFEHLLSGIRSIYEAVSFLDLNTGDRLGHATAIGIDPQYWLDSMPDTVFISQGQYLEDLLFLRHIALEIPDEPMPLAHIEANINKTASKIFPSEGYSIEILQEFFELRHLYPDIVNKVIENTKKNLTYIGWLNDEYELIKNVNPKVLQLLSLRWFNKETISLYQKKHEYQISEFGYDILLKAQQFTQSIIAKRHVIIETLPTSNVRISHYNSIYQHHVFRWLGIGKHKVDGDSPLLVTIGSDDPGIFATDLRNEFYHLFSALVCKFEYSVEEALTVVSKLNENGRVYRFSYAKIPISIQARALAEKY